MRRGASLAVLIAVAGLSMVLSPRRGAAGTITQNCGQLGSAWGPSAFECTLRFRGEIVRGDAARLDAAIRSSPNHVSLVRFDSPGGNPFEALKIADVLNAAFAGFDTAFCFYGGCTAKNAERCISACALIFLAANERYGTEVFIHRPTFPAEMLGGLSGPQAEGAYETAVDRLLAQLRAHRIPEAQIQAMMGIPSVNLSKLPSDYPSNSAWMDEWLTAKCGQSHPANAGGLIAKNLICRVRAVIEEERRVQGKY